MMEWVQYSPDENNQLRISKNDGEKIGFFFIVPYVFVPNPFRKRIGAELIIPTRIFSSIIFLEGCYQFIM